MKERAIRWEPVADITTGFGSIAFNHEHGILVVTMVGAKILTIRFSGLIGLRFEDECPSFDPHPVDLPMLEPRLTFPLLRIENSRWLEQFKGIHDGRVHFSLISQSHLVQLLAKPDVEARWQ